MTGHFCNSFMNIYNRYFNAPKLLQHGHYSYGKVMAHGYYYDKKNLGSSALPVGMEVKLHKG